MTDRFVVTSVPGAGISPDGDAVVAVLDDGEGKQLELVAPYVCFEEILSAFSEASRKAFDRRRELGRVDKSLPAGDIPKSRLVSYRYAVADDRTHMLLQMQTPNGRLDIEIPAAIAQIFAEATQRNATWLSTPPKGKGN